MLQARQAFSEATLCVQLRVGSHSSTNAGRSGLVRDLRAPQPCGCRKTAPMRRCHASGPSYGSRSDHCAVVQRKSSRSTDESWGAVPDVEEEEFERRPSLPGTTGGHARDPLPAPSPSSTVCRNRRLPARSATPWGHVPQFSPFPGRRPREATSCSPSPVRRASRRRCSRRRECQARPRTAATGSSRWVATAVETLVNCRARRGRDQKG